MFFDVDSTFFLTVTVTVIDNWFHSLLFLYKAFESLGGEGQKEYQFFEIECNRYKESGAPISDAPLPY